MLTRCRIWSLSDTGKMLGAGTGFGVSRSACSAVLEAACNSAGYSRLRSCTPMVLSIRASRSCFQFIFQQPPSSTIPAAVRRSVKRAKELTTAVHRSAVVNHTARPLSSNHHCWTRLGCLVPSKSGLTRQLVPILDERLIGKTLATNRKTAAPALLGPEASPHRRGDFLRRL